MQLRSWGSGDIESMLSNCSDQRLKGITGFGGGGGGDINEAFYCLDETMILRALFLLLLLLLLLLSFLLSPLWLQFLLLLLLLLWLHLSSFSSSSWSSWICSCSCFVI